MALAINPLPHTSGPWQSLVFFSAAIAYFGVSHERNHTVSWGRTHGAARVGSFLLMAKWYSFVWMCHNLSIRSWCWTLKELY